MIYYYSDDGQPRYLIIKRHARSKKIERVAPKGKVEWDETPEHTCVREINEETSLDISKLQVKQQLGTVQIKNINYGQWYNEKEVNYYLVHHTGAPEEVNIQAVEWFVGVYKRATITEISNLILYPTMREIFHKAHHFLTQTDQ